MSDAVSQGIPIRFTDPTQERDKLQRIAAEVSKVLTASEEILYVALQGGAGAITKSDAVVATNNRLIFYRRPVIGGAQFVDIHWQDVKDVKLKLGMMAAEIHAQTTEGKGWMLGWIDKDQAKRFYGIAQEKEEEWREKRRQRELEADRARAGGITMNAAPAVPAAAAPAPPSAVVAEDPVSRLAKAKAMLDQGLIDQAEYDTLKAKILAAM